MTAISSASAARASQGIEGLCSDHLPIVGYEVRALSARLPSHIAVDDLMSAGMHALAAAAASFDPERGVPFGRYAAMRIKGALLDELRSMDWASRSVRSKAREQDAAREGLTAEFGREPAEREVAARLGVSVAEVRATSRAVHQSVVVRLDTLVDSGVADAALPRVERSPEDVVVEREREAYLAAAVEALPERHRAVVRAAFFEDRLLKDVAAELGVTESRASQLRTEALGMLRDGLTTALDEDRPAIPVPSGVVARRRAAYAAEIAQRATLAQRGTLASAVAPMRRAV